MSSQSSATRLRSAEGPGKAEQDEGAVPSALQAVAGPERHRNDALGRGWRLFPRCRPEGALEELTDEGLIQFYADAEAVLARLPRRGVPMILKAKANGTTEPFEIMLMGKLVRKLQDRLGLPATFTLDACRHGGMTELEEAELTDG